jgi:UDP:flavonoid glycosyltransferase YjiC (YdhE family)
MRVLFCTTGGLGHLLPLRPLALALRSRGHSVAWVTAPDALPVLQSNGFELFAAGPTFEDSRRRFRAAYADAARLTGEPLSAYTFPRLFGAVLGPAMLADVGQAIVRWRPEIVVHEAAALAVPLACAQHGLRNVTHGYGLRPPPRYLEDAMAFFGSHWRSRGLEAPAGGGLYRHLYLDIAPESLQPPSGPADRVIRLNAYRPANQLPPTLPAELQAVLQRPAARRPRIYVTFGTVFNRSSALNTAARAAAMIGGTVVVTAGTNGDPRPLMELGPNVHVHRFVDQAALLQYCDVVVSHGGAGALLGAASHGVPHLILPQAADHFRNARALSRANAGRALEPECQTLESVIASLTAMLRDDVLEAGARALAREMAAMPDAAAAADALPRWLACTPPDSW